MVEDETKWIGKLMDRLGRQLDLLLSDSIKSPRRRLDSQSLMKKSELCLDLSLCPLL